MGFHSPLIRDPGYLWGENVALGAGYLVPQVLPLYTLPFAGPFESMIFPFESMIFPFESMGYVR